MHLHSRYSDRPDEWFLRRIGAPESFMEPARLYEQALAQGMDFFTISDHNRIDGVREVADRPNVFLSAEVTTYFPEDGCKIHCLVAGMDERQFQRIQDCRESVYDLQRYLAGEQLFYAAVHPLYRVNDRLTPEHIEKMLLLFPAFEALNGTRDRRMNLLVRLLLEELTPEWIAQLADRHNLAPVGPEPWRKRMIGGSDDRGGLYAAMAWTATPPATTAQEFLGHLRAGRCQPGGAEGASVRLARSLYYMAWEFYRQRFLRNATRDNSLVGALLNRLLQRQRRQRWFRRPNRFILRVGMAYHRRRMNDVERVLADEIFKMLDIREARPPPGQTPEALTHDTASRISQKLGFAILLKITRQIGKGSLVESLQSASALAPVALGILPYLAAYRSQNKDRALLDAVAAMRPGLRERWRGKVRKVWVTDTFDAVNGVAHTIDRMCALALRQRRDVTVLTCQEEVPGTSYPIHNFTPVGTFPLPEYNSITIVFPPFLDVLRYLEDQHVSEVIISTPGPFGLVAAGAARLLNLPVTGIYHTDFPKYVLHLTDDVTMEDLAWKYMLWFYGNMEKVYAPSEFYRAQLEQKGIRKEKLGVLPRGVDAELFTPGRRQAGFWAAQRLRRPFVFLYAGRVSTEKNIEALLKAFIQLAAADREVGLAVVGDGPDLDKLRKAYRRPDIVFTGFLRGEKLAEAYASADVFVFPSLTDTFGNVVTEAHACGLPAIVTNRGGPQEIVRSHGSGLVCEGTPASLRDAMKRLREDRRLYENMKAGALARAAASRWEIPVERLLC